MELADALKKIRDDDALTSRFVKEPKEVLEELGVNTANLNIKEVEGGKHEISDDDLDKISGGLSVCGSAGAAFCISVGS